METKEFAIAFVEKYPQSAVIMSHFREATGLSPAWGNLTRTNLIAFVRYLKEIVSPSSARTYAAMVKSLVNDYREEVDIPCKKYDEVLTLKRVKSINVFLTELEIYAISKYNPLTITELYVRNIFILGCITGARHSDCVNFNEKNIIGDHIIYMSEKTKTRISVPSSRLTVRSIEQLRVAKPVNEANFNILLRKICKKCKLSGEMKIYRAGQNMEGEKWKFISSHTARRSFATNLYLRGADLYSISQMMGHADVSTTEGYICCGLREQSEKVMNFFKKFE